MDFKIRNHQRPSTHPQILTRCKIKHIRLRVINLDYGYIPLVHFIHRKWFLHVLSLILKPTHLFSRAILTGTMDKTMHQPKSLWCKDFKFRWKYWTIPKINDRLKVKWIINRYLLQTTYLCGCCMKSTRSAAGVTFKVVPRQRNRSHDLEWSSAFSMISPSKWSRKLIMVSFRNPLQP